jgi:hypothetical protein
MKRFDPNDARTYANQERLRKIGPGAELYRDRKTGIAWVADTNAGIGHSAHPTIDASGSIEGMKARGSWGREDRVVRSHGFYYNVSRTLVSSAYDRVAARACRCGGVHPVDAPRRAGASSGWASKRERDARTIRDARALLADHALRLDMYRATVRADADSPNPVSVVFKRRRTGAVLRISRVWVGDDGGILQAGVNDGELTF